MIASNYLPCAYPSTVRSCHLFASSSFKHLKHFQMKIKGHQLLLSFLWYLHACSCTVLVACMLHAVPNIWLVSCFSSLRNSFGRLTSVICRISLFLNVSVYYSSASLKVCYSLLTGILSVISSNM